MDLKNSACVLTGGARGLGAALACELVSRGAQVLISDLNSTELSDLGIELDAPTMHCDVTDQEEVASLARAAMDEWGRIDLWINNAGVWAPYVAVENIDFNTAHRLIEVNYFGTAYGTVEALRHMQEKGGTVVNVLSVRALKGKANAAIYSASKFAAEGFTQAVREELREAGSDIRLIGVYPYRMKTELFGDNKHADYETSMAPRDVAKIMLDNIEKDDAALHQEIWTSEDVRTKAL